MISPLSLPRRVSHLATSFVVERIGGKIIIPYLALVCLLGVFLAYVLMSLVATSIEEKFREDLADGGRAANLAMLKVEEQQINILRQMLFTEGVANAVESADLVQLQRLLAPIQMNTRIGYVDVFNARGQLVFALRPAERQTDAARLVDLQASEWQPVRRVLDRVVDDLGDKHAGVVRAGWGEHLLYSAGPVMRGSELVGAIAVGTPLPVVVGRLSQEAVVGVTLYDEQGRPFTSSVQAMTESYALDQPDLDAVTRLGRVVARPLTLGEDRVVEMVGALVVRRQPAVVMGVSKPVNLIEETGTRTRDLMIAVFTVVLVVVLAFGAWLARQLTRPIEALVDAAENVKGGNLEVEVPILSRDETGVLARGFNEMVGGLRERNKARDAFGRYFSDDFYALVQQGRLELGGETREITILLSDIRSFTTLSEGMHPEDLVAMLNDYFAGQVAAIKRWGGEVDKYMGDAILAKFGAPVWYPDHARRAVLAMLGMREALEEFNRRRIERGEHPIRIGIGANSGPAVVGNIGSTARMEYTIIGDTVNTTQRIEDLCKELRWDLLISDTTYEQVRDLVEVGEPHAMTLRGRQRETLIYPLIGLKASALVDGAEAVLAASGVGVAHATNGAHAADDADGAVVAAERGTAGMT